MNEGATKNTPNALLALAGQVRARRKVLGVNATAVAEAAAVSRVTLHRIERGEATVSMGAYLRVLDALGMSLSANDRTPLDPAQHIPVRISLEKYPQLKKLAWQLKPGAELTPLEALGIYQRNARHIDHQALDPAERALIDALRLGLEEGARHV